MRKIKPIISLLLLFSAIFSACVSSSSDNSYWKGTMVIMEKSVDIELNLDALNPTFSSMDLMLLDLPVSDLKLTNETVEFTVVFDVTMKFSGQIKKGKMWGKVEMQGGPQNLYISFHSEKQRTLPGKAYDVEEMTVNGKGVELSARLYVPLKEGPHPGIVLLQGSSTNLKSDYVFDADFFAKRGFEVLTFDKRGNGGSSGYYYTSSYDDMVADAIACLEVLNNRESIDKDKIGLWGYSQGAMLLPRVCEQSQIASFIIAKSPEIVSVTEAAAYSDSLNLIHAGLTAPLAQIAAESHRQVERMIGEGRSANEVESFIHKNARQYSFMDRTGLYNGLEIDTLEYSGFYWKGRTERFLYGWEDLSIPALVLFGERDALVDAAKNEKLLKSFAKENIFTEVFPRANHHLKMTYIPMIDDEFDWPRLVERYGNTVDQWLKESGIID